jgi:hypothetical protein
MGGVPALFISPEEMLCELFPSEVDRAPRDFRVKFPDDILHENLAGQLWFGAEVSGGDGGGGSLALSLSS